MVALAGCSAGENTGQAESEDLASDTGQDIADVTIGGSYGYEIKMTEKNQFGLVRAQPPFIMDHSLERANLIERYKYLNDRSNVHHVYMLSDTGKVIGYEMAQGKVSSVNSKLTNNRQIVGSDQCIAEVHNDAEGACFKAVESPQMDGSYGTNGDGIFWFTPEGHYMEYNGKYVVSEEPKNIQTEVTLVDVVNDDGNNVTDTNSTDEDNSTDESA